MAAKCQACQVAHPRMSCATYRASLTGQVTKKEAKAITRQNRRFVNQTRRDKKS